LGPHAERRPDLPRQRALARGRPRRRHRAGRAGIQSPGRRAARSLRRPAGERIVSLAVERLAIRLGPRVVVSDVGFRLEDGATLGIVGESGSGKSLLALAMIGLLPASMRAQGRVLLDGEELLALPESALCRLRGARIGMIFQEPATALNPAMRIGEQIAEGL